MTKEQYQDGYQGDQGDEDGMQQDGRQGGEDGIAGSPGLLEAVADALGVLSTVLGDNAALDGQASGEFKPAEQPLEQPEARELPSRIGRRSDPRHAPQRPATGPAADTDTAERDGESAQRICEQIEHLVADLRAHKQEPDAQDKPPAQKEKLRARVLLREQKRLLGRLSLGSSPCHDGAGAAAGEAPMLTWRLRSAAAELRGLLSDLPGGC